ncbi:MAG: CDP-glucose 4,6-dehydratase [Victivallaceae bacterium]|nr:CDP-glucose 4,6-dehydratase [Victivallaceae bacterium]
MFNGIYNGRRVLLTGHTGFKGSWLAFWLRELGATICGVSLPMHRPNHYELLTPAPAARSATADIRDPAALQRIFAEFQPDIVFHLAAQALVRPGYHDPVETFSTNIMGTVNVLEAVRSTPGVKAVVAVSSDKCYEPVESGRGCRETDAMGGYDPYSASKGCAELVIASYRRSFFDAAGAGQRRTLIASARAGNVIGGGDWATDRLVPDLMKAASQNRTATIRNPEAIRPWQHVLEPLAGYLTLGAQLYQNRTVLSSSWNFGPMNNGEITVAEMAEALSEVWPAIAFRIAPPPDAPHETQLLKLDCAKAEEQLQWHTVWDTRTAIRRTAQWYKEYYRNGRINTAADLSAYIAAAEKDGLSWIK